jgi:hypothetical protein
VIAVVPDLSEYGLTLCKIHLVTNSDRPEDRDDVSDMGERIFLRWVFPLIVGREHA